jgi:putative spermidine/putrescine transport system substrate-binding protein
MREFYMTDADLRDQTDGHGISRRELLQRGVLGGAGLAAFASLSLGDVGDAFAAFEDASTGNMKSLVQAAKKEGHLNTIALPRDWANYGEVLDTFKSLYGISENNAAPLDASLQEIQAIKSLKGTSRAPDVVDVSPAVAIEGKNDGLFAKYKVATYSTIPANMKDPHANWYGDYWGVMSFISLDSQVKNPPKTWSDLLKPEYKGQVALGGVPTSSGEALGAVIGAALASGGSLDNIQAGIDFFAKLKANGNWNPTLGNEVSNIAKGVTPIVIRWDYLNLANRDELAKSSQTSTVSIPATGRYGGFYCQAISRFAPNPHAAKLWMEFIYSDQGQLLFLKGYTHPARYGDLAKRGKVPASLAKKLPAASNYKNVHFASNAQQTKALNLVTKQWTAKMGS